MARTKKNTTIDSTRSLELRKPRLPVKFDFSKISPDFLETSREFFASEAFQKLEAELDKDKMLKEIYKKKANVVFEYKGYKCKIIRTKEGFWGIAKNPEFTSFRREEPNTTKQGEIDSLKATIDAIIEEETEILNQRKKRRAIKAQSLV